MAHSKFSHGNTPAKFSRLKKRNKITRKNLNKVPPKKYLEKAYKLIYPSKTSKIVGGLVERVAYALANYEHLKRGTEL